MKISGVNFWALILMVALFGASERECGDDRCKTKDGRV